MGRLQMLKPRVGAAPSRMPAPAATDRIRGYALQKIRDRIMRRDAGICRCDDCQRTGALKPAHEVDHRVPLWAGGAEDDDNRISINADCHKRKSASEAKLRAAGMLP